MSPSLRALLTHIVDYAGLFPPASLPLDEAIRNYAGYLGAADAWMLGRFVCPVSRFAELTPFINLFESGSRLAISALGRGGNTASEFLEHLSADLGAIEQFIHQHGGRVSVDALEVRLPAEVVQDNLRNVYQLFDDAGERLRSSTRRMSIWYEAGFDPRWRETMANTVASLSQRATPPVVGLKVRCGGQDASAFPGVEELAFAITACRDLSVPLKFTAGLHHPLRRLDAGVQTKMHGFLNVFAAGVLAHARKLSEAELRAILSEENAGAFRFDDAGMQWKNHRATVAEIAAVRSQLVTSFGSCSFDEPREDLRALGLLF